MFLPIFPDPLTRFPDYTCVELVHLADKPCQSLSDNLQSLLSWPLKASEYLSGLPGSSARPRGVDG